LDGLSLMDCRISFQKKLPIMLGQNLLRLIRNEGIATWLDEPLRVLQLCSSDTNETGKLGNLSWWK